MKQYMAKEEFAEMIYGDQEPVVIDEEELNRLSMEWGTDLHDQVYEVTA